MSPSTDKVYSLLKPCLSVVWFIESHPLRVLCRVHGRVRSRQPQENTYQFNAMLIQYICHSFKFLVISNRLLVHRFWENTEQNGCGSQARVSVFSEVSCIECWEIRISSGTLTAASAHLPMTWTQT